MHMARELALCSLVDLAREFPIAIDADTLRKARQLRDSIIFAERGAE
jgi:hypothetical protein